MLTNEERAEILKTIGVKAEETSNTETGTSKIDDKNLVDHFATFTKYAGTSKSISIVIAIILVQKFDTFSNMDILLLGYAIDYAINGFFVLLFKGFGKK